MQYQVSDSICIANDSFFLGQFLSCQSSKPESYFLFAVWRRWVMPRIRIVVDDVIPSRYAHVHDIMRARHLSDKV